MAIEPYDPHPHKQPFDPEFLAIVRVILVVGALAALLYWLG
ncbi:hypothetical protein OHA70_24995 [Kribbella sp. NBC_00382]